MTKWADYLISEVSYDLDHLISVAIRHQDTEKGITEGKPVDRLTIASDIKNGLFYITIYSGKDSWKKGNKINSFSIDGNPYLRIDGNKVKLDYLGDLPESSIVVSTPKELELVLEPAEEVPKPSSPRGSLPKQSTEELSQELELVPEPAEEVPEEATPEQFTQLNELQQQIDELEDILSTKLIPSTDEPTSEQLSRVKQLEKEIEKLENINAEQKIIKSLHKQNKKLDKIEKKLNRSTKKISKKSDPTEAYCVRCKTKRKIKNPEETTMKNGRAAVKGTCSVCNCKVFRIGKLKK